MSPLVRLDCELHQAREYFKHMMCRSVAKMLQTVNLSINEVSLHPYIFIEQRKRMLLRAKTVALIKMDQEQLAATRSLEINKNLAYNKFKQSQLPPTPKSAWFSGEYDERTYY